MLWKSKRKPKLERRPVPTALHYVVEVKAGRPVWEPIAGFNVDRAALAYGGECHMVNQKLGMLYRVVNYDTGRVVYDWSAPRAKV